MSQETVGPRSEFAEKFLNSNARIIVAGGAAGSGKSYTGLMRHLRWANDPYYRGFCIRKNSTAIMKSGGLFDEAVDLYRKVHPKIQIKLKDQKIVFPSGANVSFSHYENDKAQDLYHGLQLSNVFYDESSQASESHIWWLISRLRTKAKLDPSIWLTCNPDPDSFLADWVKWWLYPEGHENFGLPDPEKNGVIRWIVRIAGEMYWGDSKEELIIRHGKPNLPIDHPHQIKPLSIQVLLGTIYDNPVLMETQPEYLASLEALPDVERRRLLLGDWNARQQNSTYFQRSWVEEIPCIDESEVVATVRAFDFAVTLKSDSNPSPDYTTSVRIRKLKDGKYVIDDIRRTRIRAGDWYNFVIDCTVDDPDMTDYYIPQDPGAAAKRATELFINELIESGLYAKKITTNKSKLERFRPFSAMAQNGGIFIVKNCGIDLENNIINDNNFYYKELEGFTGERKRGENGHDDLVDATSDAFYAIATVKEFGNFAKTLASTMKDMFVSPKLF